MIFQEALTTMNTLYSDVITPAAREKKLELLSYLDFKQYNS